MPDLVAPPFAAPSAELPARLAGIVAALPNAVLCLNRDWYITYANAEAVRISRIDADLVHTRTHWELYPATLGTEVESNYRAVMELRQPRQFEVFYAPFKITLDIHVLPTDEGIALFYSDVSAQRLAESRESAATRQMRQVFDADPHGIVIVDRDWNPTFANDRALGFFHHPAASFLGANLFQSLPGVLLEPFYSAFSRTMLRRTPASLEGFYSEPVNRWFKIQVRPYEEGIIFFMSDITERKKAELRESETARSLAQVLEVTSDAIFALDRDWRFTFLNPRAYRILDPEHRLVGRNVWEEFPAAASGPFWDNYHHTMDEGLTSNFEAFYPAPLNLWFAIQAQPAPSGIVVFFRDITAQKTHDETVRNQDDLLAVVQKASRLATWDIDLNTGAVRYGPGSFEVFGHPHQALSTSESVSAIMLPEHVDRIAAELEQAVRSGEPAVMLFAVRAADGSVIWVESRGQAVGDENGNSRMRGMSIDVTERRIDQLELIASEERYRVLADLNPQAIWMGDAAGNITYANQGFLAYIGLTLQTISGLGWLDAFAPEDRDRVVEAWTRSVTTGIDYDIEARIRNVATREYRFWHLRAAPVRDITGNILHWLGVGNDIHEARTYAETLRRQQEETERRRAELETLYKTTPVGLALLDPVDFKFLNLNDREAEILGYPKDYILGRPLAEIAPPASIPGLLDIMRSVARGTVIKDRLLEGELPSRPGEPRAWSVNYSPIYAEDGSIRAISTASIEITNQKKAEAALIQSEKLAAVGRLASSISHEINNPLEAVTNLLYLLNFDPALPDHLKIYVQTAQSELSRVSQIATQTLRFHRQAVAPTVVTPADLVGAVVRLYTGRLTNSNIVVDIRYSTDTRILCFENDIRQVLNNLIANAIDAMRTGGRLIVRAHDAEDADLSPGSAPRRGVRITIADTGHGMSERVAARIFEPFFTTKDLQGTGLGLWISAGIVERHHGRLRVRSSEHPVHHGTMFTLFLPCEPTPPEPDSEIVATA